MKIADVIATLEQWAPPAFQENYDNSGLILGSPDEDLKGILICLDVTEKVIGEAAAAGSNLIVSHHPLLFRPVSSITDGDHVGRTILSAIRHGIALYAIHTNLDNISAGVNHMICEKLGLHDGRVLSPMTGLLRKLITFVPERHLDKVRQAVFEAGAGRIGNYDACSFNSTGTGTFRAGEGTKPFVGTKGELHEEPEVRLETVFPAYLERDVIRAVIEAHPYEEVAYDVVRLENAHPRVGAGMVGALHEPMAVPAFLDHIARSMRLEFIRHSGSFRKKIETVAVCGGSGSHLLEAAIGAGAQAFVTADIKYHRFFDADDRILLADIGHYESERFTIRLIHRFLTEKNAKFAPRLSKTVTNPIKYFPGHGRSKRKNN